MLNKLAQSIGYTQKELSAIPEGSFIGWGCGNPVSRAAIKKNEVIIDLGCGAGIDVFLAANRVGDKGKVIGVDRNTTMIETARRNSVKGNYSNVVFCQGDIQKMPIKDNIADVVMSNFVINFRTDQKRVFKEAFRIFKERGRLILADMVSLEDFSERIVALLKACGEDVSVIFRKNEYLQAIKEAGFKNLEILKEERAILWYVDTDEVAAKIAKRLPKKDIQVINNNLVAIELLARK